MDCTGGSGATRDRLPEQFSTNGGTTWTTATATLCRRRRAATITGLTNGTAHVFRVAAVNGHRHRGV
jgi:hypothetical protein